MLAALAAALLAPATARAADPARWTLMGTTPLPILYYQGVTVDPQSNFYFDGIFVGLYRTSSDLRETGRNDDVIPPTVKAAEGYNHVGDISWDAREGGRILLPLECYVPGGPNGGNTCQTGSIGVADPQTLQWRYYVKLDPVEIKKAMWNELSPDGELVWTSSGPDLLAYATADITQANEAPGGAVIHAVRRLPGAVPPSGITGATFIDGRLYVAGQGGGPFRVWSIDTTTGERRLEIDREIVGESEGLVTAPLKGGLLHWLVQPYNPEGRPPTYGPDHATLLHFRPGGPDPAPAAAARPPRVRLLRRSRATVLRRGGFLATVRCPSRCSARLSVRANGRTLARASTRRPGTVRVRLTRQGRRVLGENGPLRLTLRATVRADGVTRHTVRSRLR
jgi:hypothetical protein